MNNGELEYRELGRAIGRYERLGRDDKMCHSNAIRNISREATSGSKSKIETESIHA